MGFLSLTPLRDIKKDPKKSARKIIDPVGLVKKTDNVLGKAGLPGHDFGLLQEDQRSSGISSPAQAAQDQYDYYLQTFAPVEKRLREQILTPDEIERLSSEAGDLAANDSDVKEFRRSLGRSGVVLGPTQEKESQQLFRRGNIGTSAGAQTRTRSGLYDLNLRNRGDYVALGRGLATSSQDALATASASETQRRNVNDQIETQNRNSQLALGATIVTTAAVVF